MKSALVRNYVVEAIVDGSVTLVGSTVSDGQMVVIPDGITVEVGYSYLNGQFVAPLPQTVVSKRDFMVRFTQEEAVAILQAAASDPVIQYAQQLMSLSDNIDVSDPYCVQYVGYLVSKSLLTQERADAILAPVPV